MTQTPSSGENRTPAATTAAYITNMRRAFHQLLDTYVGPLDYTPPAQPHLVDLGCGPCHEAPVVAEYFTSSHGRWEPTAHITGIDTDPALLEEAQELIAQETVAHPTFFALTQPAYRFLEGDARHLSALLDRPADIAIARHPNLIGQTEDWYTILSETYACMPSEGLALITTYLENEHHFATEQLRHAGFNIAVQTANEHAIPAFPNDPRRQLLLDAYVVVGQRQD